MNGIPRWLVGAFVLMLLALAGGGGWLFRAQEQHLQADVKANLAFITRLKVDQIVQWRHERLGDAAVLMESPFTGEAISRWLADPRDEAAEPILARFRSLRTHYHYSDVLLVDADGRVRLSLSGLTGQVHEDAARSLADAFREQRPALTDLHEGPDGLPPHVEAVAPFYAGKEETAEPIGAILLECDARELLYPLIQSWPTPTRSAETLLVRRDGDAILFLNELRHQKETALKLRIPLSREEVPAVMAALGRKGAMEGKDYRGVQVLAAMEAIPGSPWLMVAKIDKAEALADWRFRSVLILALILGLMAATATAAGMLLQRHAKERYRGLFHAETARRASEELSYRATLMSVGDAVIITGAEGMVRLLNPTAESLTGWRQEEACGKPLEEVLRIVGEETRHPVEDPLARVLPGGASLGPGNHALLVSRNGMEVPIDHSSVPIPDETGGITGVVIVFRDQTRERAAEVALQAVSSRQQALLAAIPDIIMELDAGNVYIWANEAGRDFFGDDVVGKEASCYFEGEHGTDGVVEPLFGGDGSVIYVESWQRKKDGQKRLFAWWCRELKGQSGKVRGSLCSARDITGLKRAEDLVRLRLSLLEFAASHALEELLRKTLDEVCTLTNSPIGFYHFVESDQETLSLQAWSTRTVEEFCRAEGKGLHYPISRAGVWVDCVREKRPVIHNDYSALPHRKGMPEGHAAVTRELVVPIMRSNRIMAILGIGNKPVDYTQEDVEVVSYLADVAWDFTMHKRAEEERRQSEESYRLLVKNIPGVVYRGHTDDGVEFFDEKIQALTGYSREDFASRRLKWADLVHPEDLASFRRVFLDALRGNREYVREYRIKRRDGEYAWVQERSQIACHEDGKIDYVSGVLFDITDRKQAEEEKEKLEAQFRQAHKMEAVGRLAGGVAHDFNNMLGVILGYTELALAELKPFDPIHANLKEVQAAANRSADLTRQLLAFSRRQTIAPRSVDLTAQTKGMERLLARIIGEDIDLLFKLSPSLWPVYMDPAQVDQIVANLAVNSRDAMPEGGKLTVETSNITLDADYCERHRGFTPGDFVMLAISDTGCGMDKETLEHVFEPFFTTKPEGKGTGLGLATVYGIVKQNNGFVNIYSEPGQGTTIKVYIPRYVGREEALPVAAEVGRPRGGSETVLLVEDEHEMSRLARIMLERLGYRVLEALGPGEAIALCEKHPGEIHLLLTDVVMPTMNGKELEGRIRTIKPAVKTLFMSGYTANAIAHRGVLEKGANFLQKPFSVDALARKVKEVLTASS